MTKDAPPTPTRALIEDGSIVEDGTCDFKREVDLASDRGKSNLIDDVVAMLNAGPGHLVIGVAEERGRFQRFEPIKGDRDAFERRLISVVQDLVEPRPLKAQVTSFEVDGGFVSVLHLPWHGRRAFMNRVTSAFLSRTGAKNLRLRRDEVRALFTPEETFERDVAALVEREIARTEQREVMQGKGPTFHLGIVPEARYERTRDPFDRGHGILKHAPLFHGGRDVFHGCEDGQEGLEKTFDRGRSITRFFIDDDWSVYCEVEHPFSDDHGRVTIHEFAETLPRFMSAVAALFAEEDLAGPFCVSMSVRNLRRSPGVAWAFPAADKLAMRPAIVDRVDDEALLAQFQRLVRRGSRYGD